MDCVDDRFKHIVDMNIDRLKIGICCADIIWPSFTDKHNYRQFIKYLKQICSFKRVYKHLREARHLQKQYDDNNIDITFYQPNNISKVYVYKLNPEYYTEPIYKHIGTDPIDV